MARRTRNDGPDTWHHVMNRAIARRSLFETREDIRFFLAGVARAVRRGHLEVHAWCVLSTHFHMLVRSPQGRLSEAMRRIQNSYVRGFNRSRRRDGPLLRGRYCSKPVTSETYRRLLVHYIDANPVQAGLCADPTDYRWCSARQYAEARSPRWLCRTWVEAWVAERANSRHFDPKDYPRRIEKRKRLGMDALVAARIKSSSARDDLDSLLRMASPAVLAWLQRNAKLADGHRNRQPSVTAACVSDNLLKLAFAQGPWSVHRKRKADDGWELLHAGLLRDIACASYPQAAHRLVVSADQARRFVARHRQLLDTNEAYGRLRLTLRERFSPTSSSSSALGECAACCPGTVRAAVAYFSLNPSAWRPVSNSQTNHMASLPPISSLTRT